MVIEINGVRKEVKEFRSLSLEDFYKEKLPSKLNDFREIFGANQLNREEEELKSIDDEFSRDLKQIDILYRKHINSLCSKDDLKQAVLNFANNYNGEGALILFRTLGSIATRIASKGLFSMYELNAIKTEEVMDFLITTLE